MEKTETLKRFDAFIESINNEPPISENEHINNRIKKTNELFDIFVEWIDNEKAIITKEFEKINYNNNVYSIPQLHIKIGLYHVRIKPDTPNTADPYFKKIIINGPHANVIIYIQENLDSIEFKFFDNWFSRLYDLTEDWFLYTLMYLCGKTPE